MFSQDQPRNQATAADGEKYLQFKSFDSVPLNVLVKHHSVLLKVALRPSSSSQENEENEEEGEPTRTVIKAVGGGLEEEEGGPTHKLIPSELRAGQSENMSLKTMRQ